MNETYMDSSPGSDLTVVSISTFLHDILDQPYAIHWTYQTLDTVQYEDESTIHTFIIRLGSAALELAMILNNDWSIQ